MRFLKFTLSAPLQSWGEDSRWDNRNTAAMPTKSGIIGLLGCCLGYPRGDGRLRQLDEQLHMAVRADNPGQVMTDFHTVHGTYGILQAANGKAREHGDTIISRRQYLQCARFVVFLWGEDSELEHCYNGMRHPKWVPYLGRKSCVPSEPLLPEWLDAPTPKDAVATFSEIEQTLCGNRIINVEAEMLPGDTLFPEERITSRRDVALRADLNEYGVRRVRAYTVRCERLGGGNVCT